jgi:predicted RNA-binding Zn ribbon-like protein
MIQSAPPPPAALFVADNLALDFINTQYGTGDMRQDYLTDDRSVLTWLRTAGVLADSFEHPAPTGLLTTACNLREASRRAVDAAMAGARPDLEVVNQVLQSGQPLRALVWDPRAGACQLITRPRDNSPVSLLEPVAAALAQLLTSDRFSFVRQCEAHDCVLYFHDLTKSHRRRWCSMATCGNRMKVAAFRSRKKER